mgnify:CR=1 FL=1
MRFHWLLKEQTVILKPPYGDYFHEHTFLIEYVCLCISLLNANIVKT